MNKQNTIIKKRKKLSLRFMYFVIAAALLIGGCSVNGLSSASSPNSNGIHTIKHVIIIMQENRSFDTYFGMYPGADGYTIKNGVPTNCVPDPETGRCVPVFQNNNPVSGGGPHDYANAVADINNGKMNGFLKEAELAKTNCADQTNPVCKVGNTLDVLGYETAANIPNYWKYAQNYVLQDHMFEPVNSWSFPSHLFMVSGWAATCKQSNNPMSCTGSVDPAEQQGGAPIYAWTDLTWLMNKNHVSWGYYLSNNNAQNCLYIQVLCAATDQRMSQVPNIWNVLPGFTDVYQDNQTSNIQQVSTFFTALRTNKLPQVSWIAPDRYVSEHPPGSIATGESYVTSVINAVMSSPEWDSTAIFLTWDDWGGYYDHVVPPVADSLGYGMRVPGLVISPYAKKGYIDHQTVSFDSYLAFIEDDFMNGQRLNPATDGRPDSRPDVREILPLAGNLLNDFNFNQQPAAPIILPVDPPTI